MRSAKYDAVIGLEIHIQLKTKSKMFCRCTNSSDRREPNQDVCPICMGHPGTLPVLNEEALHLGIRLGLALQARINKDTHFDRKNYFYPDLPKGYQISQFSNPLVSGGFVSIRHNGTTRKIQLERLHLEEDAGKNFHKGKKSYVNFNRAGVPLAEIVTMPEIASPEEARIFLQELRLIARYIGASDADMEKGQLRCDANISLKPSGTKKLNPKTEVKNLNSFKAVEKALHYEISRQTKLWEQGKPPKASATRGWDDDKLKTVAQRVKEDSHDYRYFPEPDLPPIDLDATLLDKLKRALPEIPEKKRIRFEKQYDLTREEVNLIVSDKALADYFEAVISELQRWLYSLQEVNEATEEEIWQSNKRRATKLALSWITTELFKHLKADNAVISDIKITPEDMAEFIGLVYEAKVNSSAAQTVLEHMYHKGGEPHHIAEEAGLFQMENSDEMEEIVQNVIKSNPDQVKQYQAGKEAVLKYLVGMVMKASKGKANPQVVEPMLKSYLHK